MSILILMVAFSSAVPLEQRTWLSWSTSCFWCFIWLMESFQFMLLDSMLKKTKQGIVAQWAKPPPGTLMSHIWAQVGTLRPIQLPENARGRQQVMLKDLSSYRPHESFCFACHRCTCELTIVNEVRVRIISEVISFQEFMCYLKHGYLYCIPWLLIKKGDLIHGLVIALSSAIFKSQARDRIEEFFRSQAYIFYHHFNETVPAMHFVDHSFQVVRMDSCRPGFGKNEGLHSNCASCCGNYRI